MSLSTTSTTTYTLAKYSRAYPSSQAAGSQECDSEWQHFTNPVIRLVLDLKKSARGELESYRLRVLWSLHAGQDMMEVDHRDVVFEDLDLLSFSGLTTQGGSHGLPLKAVYREAVVGIRYLHTRNVPAGLPLVYRRFQMNFQSATDATNFIEAVRHVCPCKANPPPQPNLARAATMTMAHTTPLARPPVSASTQMPPPPLPHSIQSKQPLRSSTTMQVSPASSTMVPATPLSRMSIPALVTHDTLPAAPAAPCSSSAPPASMNTIRTTTTNVNSTAPLPSSPLDDSSSTSRLPMPAAPPIATVIPSRPSQSSYDIGPSVSADVTSSSNASAYTQSPSILGPRTSLPPTVANSVSACEPQAPACDAPSSADGISNMDVDSLSFTALHPSLPKSSNLCDIPKTDLEALIAEVVREDGFVKLLESLDGLWRVKTYLRQ